MRTHPNNTKDDEISKFIFKKAMKINKEQQNDNKQ
jgi:hypothetical protein